MRVPHQIIYYFIVLALIVVAVSLKEDAISQSGLDKRKLENLLKLPDTKQKVDSLMQVIFTNRKDSSSEPLFQEAFRLVDKLGYQEVKPRLLDAYGVYKRDFSNYSEALNLHNQSLELARALKDEKAEIFALNNIGVVYRRLDENSKALNYHMEALKLSEKIGEDFSTSVALNSIGNIHIALGNYLDAIKYFELALPIAEKAQNNLGIAMNLNNIGEAYESMNQMDSASFHYDQSLVFNKKINNQKGIAICYNSLGSVLKKQNQPQKAISLFQRAFEINEGLGDKIFLVNSYNQLGDTYNMLKQYVNSEKMYNAALNLSREIGSKSEERNAYQGLMQLHANQGNYDRAYFYSKLFKQVTDSIVKENNNRHVRQMEAIYQGQKDSIQYALLENKRRNDRIIMAGGLVLLFLLFLTGVLYYLRRRLLEHNKGLQRELELRSQIASDLHDDMGSSLSSIHIFSELLRKPGNNSEELLNKIESNAKETLEALDDIIWLVKPSNDKFSNLGLHISEYAIPLFESKEIEFSIDFPESISELPLEMETRRNIFLIIKESVNNLIKYSCCTKALIQAEIKGTNICFVVKDNGKGFDPDMLTNRNGLKNIKARANQIHAPITIQSAPGKGTEISFNIQLGENLATAV